ncbi:thymidine kinase [Plakobranchus ocellatus]|uniref:Thymidine kinase n=1 Tax=Plakobranchus ocellatus TaxID=259542 RepID=A0AAV4D1U0_9GAST|nr:thymidine kinase [Plakobranchus ocellatus]
MSSHTILHPSVQAVSHGQIQVIFGPMFSGKTTELMRRMKRYQIANQKCMIIKYAKDVRYDTSGIATHDKQVLSAWPTENLTDLYSEACKHDVIGIDEGQFYPEIVSFCDKLAELGKVVIVAALDGTFQKKGFGDILNLVPIAESVIKLNAVCMSCFGEGSFTKRKGSEKKVEVIGGAEMYLATCRGCFHSPAKSRSPLKSINTNTVIDSNVKNATKNLFAKDIKNICIQ